MIHTHRLTGESCVMPDKPRSSDGGKATQQVAHPNAAHELERFLSKVAGSGDDALLVISATDIVGEGARERLHALTNALKTYRKTTGEE